MEQAELQKQHNEDLLKAIYKNAQMGISGIKNIMPAVNDGKMRRVLKKQENKYIDISQSASQKALAYEVELKEINIFAKGMAYTSIKLKSLMDSTTSHLADMLVQGTTMGITDVIKKQSENSLASEDISTLARDLQKAEEEFVDTLKTFLAK